ASAVHVAAWNVGLLTAALKRAADRNPSWVVASHDALCADPEPRFRALVEQLGLEWTEAMGAYLRTSDDPRFVVLGGSQRVHPNAGSSTASESRRTQQATQFTRRLDAAQTD